MTKFGVTPNLTGATPVPPGAPPPLRPLIRKRFQGAFTHPVLLDWRGNVVRRLDCAPHEANVFALATNGAVLLSLRGAPEQSKMTNLFAVIDANRFAENSRKECSGSATNH